MLLLLVVLINQILSYWYISIMSESSFAKVDQKYEALKEGEHFDFLIMGNSHTFSLMDNLSNSMFSFGTTGESIDQTYYKLVDAVHNKKLKIDTLIIPLDLDYLKERKMDNSRYPFFWNKYLRFYNYLSESNEKWSFVKNTILGYAVPYVNGTNDVFDYYFSEGKGNQLRNEGKVVADSLVNYKIPTGELGKEYLDQYFYLEKIDVLCKENGIELVMISFPVTKAYYSKTATEMDPEMYFALIKDRLEKKGLSFNHINLSREYCSDKFRDPHHLGDNNIRVEFTELVKKKIKELKGEHINE